MLYNSYPFIFIYLPAVFAGFFLLARESAMLASLGLAVASLFFYAWWNPAYVTLLLGSIAFNFSMGRAIDRVRREPGQGARRLGAGGLAALAIAADLALLGYYKYANFFIATFNGIAGTHAGMRDIVLPLGISFFTFTQIAFLADVYRGVAKESSFLHYLLFVTYFPHLVAGPVLHHKQMMPQFEAKDACRIDWTNVAVGLTYFTLGLGKKVLLADSIAPIADGVFDAARRGENVMLFDAWAGAFAYAFQLYFDFSGYSDMAIGLSRLFNIRLPFNFDSPYRAASMIDFWRRWHMTLSAFLRDYLYIPLGGNRCGQVRRHINLMLTMLLGGLWHGANWTFVAWGGLHGVFLVINHLWRAALGGPGANRAAPSRLARGMAWMLTFLCAVVAWVFFRADTFATAQAMLAGMAGMHGISVGIAFEHAAWVHWLMQHPSFYIELLGFLPHATGASGLSVLEVVLLITAAAGIAWLMPNTQQLLEGGISGSTQPQATLLRPLRQAGVWRADSSVWRIAAGLMLGCAIFAINRQSTFLYFQF